MALHAVDADKPKPIMAIETRPSTLTGISWWVVLSYKEHNFQAMLPPDFGGMEIEAQNFAVLSAVEPLRKKLAPILIAEDMGEPEGANADAL